LPPPAAPGARHGVDHPPDPAPEGPISTLRGAGVQVDGQKITRVLVAVVLVTLLVLVVAFTVAGLHKNAQIDRLHRDGVDVTVHVTSCQGLLGGSGSNLVGYSCSGSYALGGHRYTVHLPGTSGYAPDSSVPSVAVPADPALVAPVNALRNERASAGVFALPGTLLAVLAAIVLLLVHRSRRNNQAQQRPPA